MQRRMWLADLAERRLRTAALRTVCTWIAGTVQTEPGTENPMVDEAARITLGTGTEPPDGEPATQSVGAGPQTVRVGAPVGNTADRPAARLRLADLPDGPAAVRVGQHSPHPDGVNPVPLDKLGTLFGGGPR